jgi:PAS domain S-box-containing protein
VPKQKIHILLVEDNPGDVRIVCEMVRHTPELEIHNVDGLAAGIAQLNAQKWDLVLLDLGLPDSQGLDTLRGVIKLGSSVPVVVLTGQDDEDIGQIAVQEGAQDYLVKGRIAEQAIARAARFAIERKRIETRIAEALKSWNATFDAMQDGICLLDPEGHILQSNRAMQLLTGLSREEMKGRHCYEILHGQPDIVAGCPIGRMLESGKRETSELFMNGSWFEAIVDPLYDEANVITGAVHILRNVTESKKAKETLAASEARARELFNACPEGIIVVRSDGCIDQVNIAHARMYGYGSPTDLVGLHVSQLVAPSHRDYGLQNVRRRLNGEEIPTVEYEMVRKDGTTFLAETSATILHSADGAVSGFISSTRDISERKRVHQELKESKQLMETIVENVPLMIFLKEARDLRFVVFNRAGEDLLGYKRKDLLGKNNLDLFPPEQAAFFMARDREVLENDNLLDIPMEPISTAYKGNRLLHTRKICVKGADGVTKYLLGISEDITEQKRAEAEITSLNAKLEKRVLERTAQLQSANQELEAFAYSISHDLKAPLRSISGFSQALREDYAPLLGPEGEGLLRCVEEEAVRMNVLIDDLLRLARLGQQAMSIENLDLTPIVHSILENLAAQDPQRQVRCELASGLEVHGDPILVRVLLENLLGNAWKFTSRTKDARIRVRQEPNEPGWSRFSVADNGAGFDPTYADRLFAPFGRLHSSDEFPGTGIGLAIVRRIVHRHGAQIQAEGSPGNGATFTLAFPVSALQP